MKHQVVDGPKLNVIPTGYVHSHIGDVKRRKSENGEIFLRENEANGRVVLANGYESNAEAQRKAEKT